MEGRGPDGLGPGGPGSRDNRRGRCRGCCSKLASILCSNFGICLLVLLYTVAGAFLFSTIEGGTTRIILEEPSIQHVTAEEALSTTAKPKTKGAKAEPVINPHASIRQLQQETVERLWTITESLNILYRDNWTRVAENELKRFSKHLLGNFRHSGDHQTAASRDFKAAQPHQWSFAGSFLYSLTVITTVGYGAVAPHTGLGKVVTILYALLGIPLMLLYLSSVGDLLSRILKWIWSKMCRCGKKKRPKSPAVPLIRSNHLPGSYTNLDPAKVGKWADNKDDYQEEPGAIPVTLCLIIMVAYMCGGAAVFSYTHNWPFLHSMFFCFSSLTTIGFGDLSPGVGTRSELGLHISLLGTAIYLLIGMALIATCFNLMQEQVTSRSGGSLTRRFGIMSPPGAHHRFHIDDT